MQSVPRYTFTGSSAFQTDCRSVVVASSPSTSSPLVAGPLPRSASTVSVQVGMVSLTSRTSRSKVSSGCSGTKSSTATWQPVQAIAPARAIIIYFFILFNIIRLVGGNGITCKLVESQIVSGLVEHIYRSGRLGQTGVCA